MNQHRVSIWYGVCLFLACAFLALMFLQHSALRGRLQYEVGYEDVITFIDGLKRYKALVDQPQTHLQFFYQYAVDPPHAPLHSLQAGLAFAIFGINDQAPYLSNVVLLFALLFAFAYAARGFRPWAVGVGLLYLAFSPLVYHTVTEFRPDYPSAIFTIWGVLLYLEFLRRGSWKYAAFSGVCYGLAMLAKPPVFLYVMAIGVAPFLLGLVQGWRARQITGVLSAIRDSWPFFIACALIAGPHFAIAGSNIYNYIILNQTGSHAHIWAFKNGLYERLLYPINGYSGWLTFGSMWRTALLLGFGSFILGLWLSYHKKEKHNWFLIVTILIIYSYSFLVINPHMNPYFGLTFQILLLFSGASLLSFLVNLKLRPVGSLIVRLLVGLLLFSVVLQAFPLPIRNPEITNGPSEFRKFTQTVNHDVLSIIVDSRGPVVGRYVLVSTYGVLTSHTLQWMSDKEELGYTFDAVPYEGLSFAKNLLTRNVGNESAAFAIVSEEGVFGIKEELPNALFSGDILEYLMKSNQYSVIGKVEDPNGLAYVIFQRLSLD